MPLDRKKVAMGWRRLRVMIQHACLLGTFGFFLCGVPSCQSLERAPSNEGLTISSSEVFHFILFFIVRSQQNLEWIFFLFLLSSLLLGAMAFYELPWRTEKFYVSNFQRKDKKKCLKVCFWGYYWYFSVFINVLRVLKGDSQILLARLYMSGLRDKEWRFSRTLRLWSRNLVMPLLGMDRSKGNEIYIQKGHLCAMKVSIGGEVDLALWHIYTMGYYLTIGE